MIICVIQNIIIFTTNYLSNNIYQSEFCLKHGSAITLLSISLEVPPSSFINRVLHYRAQTIAH